MAGGTRYAKRPASRVVRGESSHARELGESRIRLICIAAFFGLSFFMLSARLFEVCLMGGGDLPFKKLVSQPQLLLQREDDVDVSSIPPEKGRRRDIVDRNGMVIATSIETASLVANPSIIRHEQEVAQGLHNIFPEESYTNFLAHLMQKHATFMYLRRHLTPAQQEAVNDLGVPGLFFEADQRRVYPYGSLFSQTVGYVDVDDNGIAGIEKYFDYQLDDPMDEKPLALSLDLRVQSILHDELVKTVQQFSAIGAVGVVTDIHSGEILGMVSLPEFDPHQPGKASEQARFNRATLGTYEMGSTFKTFTIAEALDAGVVNLHSGYDASQPIHVASFTISDAHPEGRWLSVPEIYAYSSNIGAAKMALDVGAARQQKTLRALGMFEPIKLEVPELARPLVPKQWGEVTTMTVAYGHGIAVSPLHLVRAIGAVVGDGHLRTLSLLKGGGKEEADEIVSEKTRYALRDLMRLVVQHGTGKMADAPGYMVGGKTGTAEKNAGGTYRKDAKVASFVGVFPANDPKYAILVMVDEPKGTKETYGYATGGWNAAPAVGRVVQRMAPLLGMKPDFASTNPRVEAMWTEAEARAQQAKLQRVQNNLQQGAIHAASF